MAPRQTAQQRARSALVPLTVISRIAQVVPYGRTSSELQRETETIKIQITKLHGTISVRENPELPEKDRLKLVDGFWDDGISGTIPLQDRPEGRRLVNLICGRGDIYCDGHCSTVAVIDQVWVTKLDRLARKLSILIDIEAFLRRHGVSLVCMDPTIDTSTGTGRLVFTILASIAEWERETILERTTNGKHQKAAEGKWVGGRKTLGYKTDENGYLIVDDTLVEACGEAAYRVVQTIFENIGLNGSTAWREAQRTGIGERRILNILHNPRYKGEGGIFDAFGKWTAAERNPPPALVSPELFDVVERTLTDNRKNSSRNRHYDYLLTRLLTCCEPTADGVCGRTFAGRTEARHKYDTRYTYYYCSRRGCTAKMLRAGDVEKAIWAEVETSIRNPDKYLEKVRNDDGVAVTQLRAELTHVVDQITRLESERQNVLVSAERGLRTLDEVEPRVKEILAAVEQKRVHASTLELQIRSATLSDFDARRSAVTIADIGAKLDEINATDDRQRKGELIRSALLHPAEVRTVDGRPHLKLTLRLGTELWIAPSTSQKSSCNPQQPLVGTAEIVLPAGPKRAA